MDIKRVTEWLTTAEGTGKALTAVLVVSTALVAAANKVFDTIGLPPWAVHSGVLLVTLAFSGSLLSSYRRFSVASRVERPDCFTLRPTGPDSLFGREGDLDKLLGAIQHHLLVLLDGESGSGKSALVLYGLIPRLKIRPAGLLPVVIREWGDDWIRGPLAGALESLFHGLTPAEREVLNWPVLPDLAASAATLTLELQTRLGAVFEILGRRPLLIADQFDDYQALHRHRFVAADGSWITPKALAQANPFWHVVSEFVTASRLRLLVVTRSDMAAGTVCTRFVDEESTTVRSLPLVEAVYLRPLLAAIAPPDVSPPVISNPERGWSELCELLERDLRGEGAILMQQVRTVLLGVRQLGVLTPRAYRASGGVRGVEILAISRALLRASRSVTAAPVADSPAGQRLLSGHA